jgi:putative ABC transport system ATP-binding protein
VGGEEKTLALVSAGEFFGDMAMFTQSPRSADVVAEGDTRLLRFGAEAFRTLIGQNPAAAAPMLFGIAGTMAHRIMEDNQRFQREVAAEFVWR